MASLLFTFASLPRTKRGAGIVLGPDPKGKTFLYTNGNSVFIRDVEEFSKCEVYTEHAKEVTCAKYSPSRFYIASADMSGKVRIWDTTQAEHILKAELQPLGGAIRDLSWTSDSQRIAVGGEGREKFCHVFAWDSGTSVGDLMGHDKAVNSLDFKQSRPFKLITGSEDRSSNFFEGPPFKLKKMIKDPKNFVNSVRFAPNGNVFAIATQDGHIFLYDAADGNMIREIGNPAHSGGIYAISFSPSSKHILSASGDKTARVFDVESGSLVSQFSTGKDIDDMLVGCLWQEPDTMLVVALSGYVHVLDAAVAVSSAEISRKKTIRGHNKPITAVTFFKRSSDSRLFYVSGSSDGRVCIWDALTGECTVVAGPGGHAAGCQIQGVAALPSTSSAAKIATCASDDTLRYIDVVDDNDNIKATFSSEFVKLKSQPAALAARADGILAVACLNHLMVIRDNFILATFDAPNGINFRAVSLSSLGDLAVGQNDKRIRIFKGIGESSVELLERQLPNEDSTQNGPITALAYSPDGKYLASADQQRRVRLFSTAEYGVEVRDEWCHSNASVTCLAWAPSGHKLVAGSVDTSITFYPVEPAGSRMTATPGQVRGAHPLAPVTALIWPEEDKVVSSGQDACLRIWSPKN